MDFGTSAGGDDNDPVDLSSGSTDYMAGDDASFTCTDGVCGSSASYSFGGTTTDYYADDYLKGNVVKATTDATIDLSQIWTLSIRGSGTLTVPS